MTKQEAIALVREVSNYMATRPEIDEAIDMAIEALEQESIKFYYVESLDDYWVGRRLDNFYYATWHGYLGFIWSHSKYLPWGEHVVDENTLWKEHTYPTEPKEIPFTEWIVGFTKKYFQQEQNCIKCKHYYETEDATGVHSHCSATCSENAQVDKFAQGGRGNRGQRITQRNIKSNRSIGRRCRMTKQFLSLEDAVLVARKEFGVDEQLALQEFEKKCYITDKQYDIGYHDALVDAISVIIGLGDELYRGMLERRE